MISNTDLQKINLKLFGIISYEPYSIYNNFFLNIDLNLNEDNIIVLSLKNNFEILKIHNKPRIKLLPGWTIEEYFHFEKLLKDHKNIDSRKKWENIKKNILNTHNFKEYLDLYKYIRNQIEEEQNRNIININYYIDKFFVQIKNNILDTSSNIIFIDCNNNLTEISKKKIINNSSNLIIFFGLDLFLLNLNLKPEEIYVKLDKLLKMYNIIDLNYKNILFCDKEQKWGFTLLNFAQLYNEHFDLTVEETINKLWGDNYYDTQEKIWLTFKNINIKRSFCQYILIPIRQLIIAINNNNISKIHEIFKNLNIDIEQFNNKLDINNIISKFAPFKKNLSKFFYNAFI